VIDRLTKLSPKRQRVPLTRTNHMLRFLYPGQAFSGWALWCENSWDFTWWHANLEASFFRTEVGVDTRDHALDIVPSPDLKWRWNDEDELGARIEFGVDTPEFASAVRAEGKRVVEFIECAASLFGESWPDWGAHPTWSPPELPEG
jgi:hypothetical protein